MEIIFKVVATGTLFFLGAFMNILFIYLTQYIWSH